MVDTLLKSEAQEKCTTNTQYHKKICVDAYFENILYIIKLYISPKVPHFFGIFVGSTFWEVENAEHIFACDIVKMWRRKIVTIFKIFRPLCC